MTEAFIICWNEIETIRFTIDHYEKFCDQLTFYDNYSDDTTDTYIESRGHKVVKFGTPGKLEDKTYVKLKNICWRQSTADWVVVVDCDEIVHHNSIKEVLQDAKGTIFKTYGFDIFSNDMPVNSFLEIQTGIYSENYSKSAVFSPKLESINFDYGCHVAKPRGDVRVCKEVLNLFHYRNIGGVERLVKRHEIYRERLSDHNRKYNLGIHYMYEDERRKKEWLEKYNQAHLFNAERVL